MLIELPRVANDVGQILLGRDPTELGLCALRGCDEFGRIARAAGRDLDPDGPAGDRSDDVDDLAVGEAMAVAEVVDAMHAGLHRGQCPQMCLGEVGHVDVIPDARAVEGRVVGAIELQGGPAAGGDVQRDRDQVGLRIMALADQRAGGRPASAGAVGAGDVEVAQ
jgi:hypothetical protein